MSGIIYTPKKPREKVLSRLGPESRLRMSEGAKRADRTNTAAARRSNSLKKYLNDHPLYDNEFYIRFNDVDKGHRRHTKTDSLHVSIDGKNWFEVSDIIEKLMEVNRK